MKPPVSTTTSPSHSTSASYQELVNFEKGAKCDAAVFELFKDDKYYDVFCQDFVATARAQVLLNICDPDYKPNKSHPCEKQLIEVQQCFVFSVLIKIIQTDFGRSLVRQHGKDQDAKVVIKELHEYHMDSALS